MPLLKKDKTELQKKVPSIKDRMEAAAKQNQLERLQYENMELKEALEEERSFSDRLLEDIDRVLICWSGICRGSFFTSSIRRGSFCRSIRHTGSNSSGREAIPGTI